MKKTPIILVAIAIGFLSGCSATTLKTTTNLDSAETVNTTNANISTDRQTEITALVNKWLVTKDDDLIHQIQNEQELEFAENLLQQLEGDTDSFSKNQITSPVLDLNPVNN